MRISFGICTVPENYERVKLTIASIRKLGISHYEILIIGDSRFSGTDIRVLDFDENEKVNWVTRKKNLLVQEASFEYIVLMHDYFEFDADWYSQLVRFGRNFDVGMCSILTLTGARYRDWCILPGNNNYMDVLTFPFRVLLPYSWDHLKKYMFISGSFWIASTQFMKCHPLDERLSWGEGEDAEWSFRIRELADIQIFPLSRVRLLKPADPKYRDLHLLTWFVLYLFKSNGARLMLESFFSAINPMFRLAAKYQRRVLKKLQNS
jgi:hypothetical protein